MKTTLLVAPALFIASMLTGCVVAPYSEPVVYAPPPPPAVVVRPAPVYYYPYRQGPYWRRGWR